MDRDQVRYFAREARQAVSEGFRPLLVPSDGKKAFQVITQTLQLEGLDPSEYLRVGREAITELAGRDVYDEIIRGVREESGQVDIFELAEQKVEELLSALHKEGIPTIDDLLRAVT